MHRMPTLKTAALAALTLMSLSGCSLLGLGGPAFEPLTGRASYPKNYEIPKGATLTVRVSDADRDHGLIAETTANEVEQSPTPFALQVDRSALDDAHRYTLEARLSANGKTLLETPKPVPVLTQGAPTRQADVSLSAPAP
ncbi:YbaY family lipoprotein [Larsenimonas salina]|uniref:YbaY family lipoprotein n=1 Tax=Larsenimonas salina TaxID=1295565 RepID=UPI0020731D7D|nr:YbaY family lipoprotein [Larsenimonas salina]MCM5704613.1 YbaY family lipoprotein [Larsenimonas salina]